VSTTIIARISGPVPERVKAIVVLMTVVTLVVMMITASEANTFHVAADGTRQFLLIQPAIQVAHSGDSVLVHPGTYNEDIDFLGKDIVLKSIAGPATTILDGTGQDSSIVILIRGETAAVLIEGFTFQNGTGTPIPGGVYGGALYAAEASARIVGNVFRNNQARLGAALHAGRIFAPDGNPDPLPSLLIDGNTFLDNSCTHLGNGGAVRIHNANCTISRNHFERNFANRDGGALDIRLNLGVVTVEDNSFVDNRAGDQGGAIQCVTSAHFGGGPVFVRKNVFIRNRSDAIVPATQGAGGGISAADMIGEISFNTFVDNFGASDGSCSGGAIKLLDATGDLSVHHNIIAFNHGCGIACRGTGEANVGPNILWGNEGGDISSDVLGCGALWAHLQIFDDPRFCGQMSGDLTVSTTSPAIRDGQQFGPFPTPGCQGVLIRASTWSQLKFRFWK
jgi:predicted outer membrane repeat protein